MRCAECGAQTAEVAQPCVRCGAPAAGQSLVAAHPAGGAANSPAAATAGDMGSVPARARLRQRYLLICFILSLILCSASMAGINKAPAYTVLSHTLGWVIGLSVVAAFLSLALFVHVLDRRSSWQVAGAWVPVLSLSFLAFVPFLWPAVIRRRVRDWAVVAAYLIAVAAEIALAYVGDQGSTAWSISYAMIPLVAGTAAVQALVAYRPTAGAPSRQDAHAVKNAGEQQSVMDAVAPEDW